LIDLHIHSTASDGSFSPREILNLAKKTKLEAIALTDHDSIDGAKEILKYSSTNDLQFITGVEISCNPPVGFKDLGSIHLLGYGFSVYDTSLNNILSKAQKARVQRNPKIIKKLNELGFDLTIKEVEDHFKTEQTGRPHIAELMKKKGYVKSFKNAFDKYLGKGKPAYVDKYKISCSNAIKIILDAGGIPILAHPGLLNFKKKQKPEDFIDKLITFGLEGIEVYYTEHNDYLTSFYKKLAEQKNLLITGGSDFHGDFNKGVALGTGIGNLNIEYSLFKALLKRLKEIQKQYTNLSSLETNIRYSFQDKTLLNTALCHRSFSNENQDSCTMNNERLEFLGDAVLGLCIGHILMKKSPLKNEGELSKLRSNLVSEPPLADMARSIDLGRFIRLGKGEAGSRGFDKNSILSDAFEAVIAAIYLDAGFEKTYKLIHDIFRQSLENLLSKDTIIDYKSLLQELIQDRKA